MGESINMPPDLLQLPPFREMSERLGNAQRALMAWWILYSSLNYLAQEGHPVGRIPEGELPLFKKTLDVIAEENQLDGLEKILYLFDLFVEVKLLKADGPEYICPRYQVLNAYGRFGKSLSSLGGSMKAYRKRQESVDADAMQQSLNIHESKFVDTESVPLSPEVTKRVTRLIIACDNALYKSSRPAAGFTEGLIQDALKIAGKFSDEEINYVCEQVALHRSHPAINGLTTERLMPQFSDMVRKLGVGE